MITKQEIETHAQQLAADRDVDEGDVIGHLDLPEHQAVMHRCCELLLEQLGEAIQKRWPN
jgi:hypothetical protein